MTHAESVNWQDPDMYELNPALRNFWEHPARNKVLPGGRASSKSHDAAGIAVFLASNYTLKILCARRFQARISESVYALVKMKIETSPFRSDWKILKTSMENKVTGSVFLFFGIERNLAEIKSLEGVDILWLEEANYITEAHWKVLEPTIRKDTSEVWFIFNPDESTDFVYDHFILQEQEDTIVRHINWDENPWLSDTMLKIIRDAYEKDPKTAEHIYGGKPKTGSDKSIIRLDYIEAAIDAHTKIKGWDDSGMVRLGFDVADDGDDLCAQVVTKGNIITFIEEWEGQEDELLKSCSKVWETARRFGAKVTYDSIGVGATCGAKFKELNDISPNWKCDYFAFNAGETVENPDKVFMQLPHTKILNKEHFENVKAQKWFEVAEKFRKTFEVITMGAKHPIEELISIDSRGISQKMLKQIKKELSSVRKDISGRGKFMAEKKEDLRKRGIKSPNVADAVIMSVILPRKKARGFFD